MADGTDKAEQLFAEGEELADAEDDAVTLDRFRAAWDALPEPREEQEPAVRILAAVADSCFFLGRWMECCDAVQHAFRCGAELDNTFLRLRLGQAMFELGNRAEATNWLVPVYLAGGGSPRSRAKTPSTWSRSAALCSRRRAGGPRGGRRSRVGRREHRHFASYTTLPPTTVSSTRVSFTASTGHVR